MCVDHQLIIKEARHFAETNFRRQIELTERIAEGQAIIDAATKELRALAQSSLYLLKIRDFCETGDGDGTSIDHDVLRFVPSLSGAGA